MKPELDKIYLWDGNSIFDNLRTKRVHKGLYRYAKNTTYKGKTKTLLLITNDPGENRADSFLSNASKHFTDKDKALFTKPAIKPVLTSVEYN